jgi:hypothetical protein
MTVEAETVTVSVSELLAEITRLKCQIIILEAERDVAVAQLTQSRMARRVPPPRMIWRE